MVEWISRAEAVAIITLRTKLPEPGHLLESAIASGRVRVNNPPPSSMHDRYPGGITYLDLDAFTPVERESLGEWLDDLMGIPSKIDTSVKLHHRDPRQRNDAIEILRSLPDDRRNGNQDACLTEVNEILKAQGKSPISLSTFKRARKQIGQKVQNPSASLKD